VSLLPIDLCLPTYHGYSIFFDPTLQAEALELWNTNKTGPDVWLGRLDHIAWVRLSKNSSIFQQFDDPSSGPNSAHYELALGVNILRQSVRRWM
jgi:hypothetical protein